ncbi:MAG: maleylpyruvate isomerase family mycothiol-dependent enzyme [Nocardioidaceae bacterium]
MTTSAALPQLEETARATQRYLQALTVLPDDRLRQPSLLPRWSVAHVVAHLTLNAEGLTGVLRAAADGQVGVMYASQDSRDADIESAAGLDTAALRDATARACAAFEEAARALGPAQVAGEFRRTPDAAPWPVAQVGSMRRTEVEIHHADLGTGYTPRDWPVDFALALVKRRQEELAAQDGGGPSMVLSSTDVDGLWKLGEGQGPTIEGRAADLAWWLVGRGDGAGLVCSAGPLPTLGRWR